MSNYSIMKLENGNVIIREGNGKARVVTPPKGVDYSVKDNCWYARHLHVDYGYWTGTYFSILEMGPIKAFKAAVDCREAAIGYLLNRRLLPRFLKEYQPLEGGDKFRVRDPFKHTYESFDSLADAEAFNEYVIEEYASQYNLPRERMITIAEFK